MMTAQATRNASWTSLPVTAIAIVISCAFSLLSVLQHPQLNDDAYGYLRAAELFNTDGAVAVLSQYSWPGYSILIALLDRVLPGDLLLAAQLLNVACYALLVYTFIALVREGGTSTRVQWFAAWTILAWPLINEMRYFLIRDFAFWGFGLLSLVHLVRFRQAGNRMSALYWCLALCAAIAFRPEGVLLAAFAPLALLVTPRQEKAWAKVGQLYALLFIALLALFAVLLALQVNLVELFQFAYRFYLPLLYDLPGVLRASVITANEAMFTAANFPGHDNIAHGGVILLFAYLYTLLANVVNALSVPASVLIAWAAWRGHARLPIALRAPVFTYAICSLVALLIFLVIMHFQTERYATFLCLLLLLRVPAILDHLYTSAITHQTQLRFRILLGFFCVYFFRDSFVSFGYSTQYVTDAMSWTRDNLPRDAALHTNEPGIAYASGLIANYDKVSSDPTVAMQEMQPAHYLALNLKARNERDEQVRAQLDSAWQLELLQTFANERGDEVRIYRRK